MSQRSLKNLNFEIIPLGQFKNKFMRQKTFSQKIEVNGMNNLKINNDYQLSHNDSNNIKNVINNNSLKTNLHHKIEKTNPYNQTTKSAINHYKNKLMFDFKNLFNFKKNEFNLDINFENKK